MSKKKKKKKLEEPVISMHMVIKTSKCINVLKIGIFLKP